MAERVGRQPRSASRGLVRAARVGSLILASSVMLASGFELSTPREVSRAEAGTTTTTSPVPASVATASDATYGPLLAVLPITGDLLVKEGALTGAWNTEHTDVQQVAVASDPTNGPLIAALLDDGTLLVKEGAITGAWNTEHTDV